MSVASAQVRGPNPKRRLPTQPALCRGALAMRCSTVLALAACALCGAAVAAAAASAATPADAIACGEEGAPCCPAATDGRNTSRPFCTVHGVVCTLTEPWARTTVCRYWPRRVVLCAVLERVQCAEILCYGRPPSCPQSHTHHRPTSLPQLSWGVRGNGGALLPLPLPRVVGLGRPAAHLRGARSSASECGRGARGQAGRPSTAGGTASTRAAVHGRAHSCCPPCVPGAEG